MHTKPVEVLIPTYNRVSALAVTLTSLYYQTEKAFHIIISDQSPEKELINDKSIQTVIRLLGLGGHTVSLVKNLPRRGMAQQRQFLLEQAQADYVLFLDDDLILEPFVLENMRRMLEEQQCGFAGCAVIGLSYMNSRRPEEQAIEFWSRVEPETIFPRSKEWERYKLHNAANILHVQQDLKLEPGNPVAYKGAWVGGCVMYERMKLVDCGGFAFWQDLPENHSGEDVLAQLRVMRAYGGCGILPSGVYHQELDTTVPDRTVNAPEFIAI